MLHSLEGSGQPGSRSRLVFLCAALALACASSHGTKIDSQGHFETNQYVGGLVFQ